MAILSFKKSAEIYNAESDYSSNYNKVKIRIADLVSSNDQSSASIIEALKIYEEIASNYLENKLTAPSSRELFVKSTLLFLVNEDQVGASNALEKY